jgi:hypothetical protein
MTTNVSEVEPPMAFEMTPCAATAFRICYKDIPGEIIVIFFYLNFLVRYNSIFIYRRIFLDTATPFLSSSNQLLCETAGINSCQSLYFFFL